MEMGNLCVGINVGHGTRLWHLKVISGTLKGHHSVVDSPQGAWETRAHALLKLGLHHHSLHEAVLKMIAFSETMVFVDPAQFLPKRWLVFGTFFNIFANKVGNRHCLIPSC